MAPGVNLGNIGSGSLRFHCKPPCSWRPPDDMTMEAAQLHFQVEHDTDEVTFDLLPVCSCGATMGFTREAPTGGGFKDYFECKACGNNGYVKRNG